MTVRILVMGLPGSGKTAFADKLRQELTSIIGVTVTWYNSDEVRKQHGDWDFSYEGRLRQVRRMRELSDKSDVDFVICDFVAPTQEIRELNSLRIGIAIDPYFIKLWRLII